METLQIVQLAILIFMVSVFVIYTWRVSSKFGISESISASFYVWKPVWKGIWFVLMTYGISIPLIVFIKLPWTWWNLLFYFATLSLVITGTAADFRTDKNTEWLHNIGSYSAIILSIAGLWVIHNIWISSALFVPLLGFLYFRKVKNVTWWVECAAFGSVVFGLIELIFTS